VSLRMDHYVSATTLLRSARDFHDALRLVAASEKPPPHATVLLAGHATENGLKAFLVQAGDFGEPALRRIGHDLAKAWRKAEGLGLAVPAIPPPWCATLSATYCGPEYFARYPRTNTIMSIPQIAGLVRDVGALLDQVTQEVIARGGTL
jgi:hypothetical protein